MTVRIDADMLIPGRGEPLTNGSVAFDGDIISYVGPRSNAPDSDHTTAVPVVMPGLWDCHAHFNGLAVPNLASQLTDSVPLRAARAAGDLHRALMGGVTSARDVGGLGLSLAPAVIEGSVQGPNLYAAGDILSTTGGHADIHEFPLEFVGKFQHFGTLCDGVDEVTKAVRTNLRRNAKVIKVCASGGVLSEIDHPMHQQFSHEELVAIVEEAGRADRHVAAHCHGKAGVMAALRAGVHTIEHGSFIDDEAARTMVEQGTIYVPTRFIVEQLLHQEELLPRYAYEKVLMVADAQAQAMKIAVAEGVKIAMGTDIVLTGDQYGRNGLEITFLQDAGLTALEAIEAATANGPDTIGPQAPRSGQLKEGYDADVIALDFNPAIDASGWGQPDRVTHVWKAGVPVKTPTP